MLNDSTDYCTLEYLLNPVTHSANLQPDLTHLSPPAGQGVWRAVRRGGCTGRGSTAAPRPAHPIHHPGEDAGRQPSHAPPGQARPAPFTQASCQRFSLNQPHDSLICIENVRLIYLFSFFCKVRHARSKP
jgi:hypothetical protein